MVDLSIDVTSICRVRILLVPVSPIKRSTFYKYVELVKHFQLIRLGDVTPDLNKGANAMFSSQVFQEGQMHFQFLTHWTRDHVDLEDFQPHRRIFGVIGIMDCQEWKDLNEGYQQFTHDLKKYPTAIANRCFAFDPSETQEDDTKGLIMIPNVGNMSFYMSTMICDFASEILEQFGAIAKNIENLQVLESPLPSRIQIKHEQENESKRFSLQPQRLHHHRRQLSSSSTSTISTTAGESMRTVKRTPGRIRKLLGDLYLLAGRLPDAINHYDHAIEMAKITSDFLWLASAMEGMVCATILLEALQLDVGHIVSRRSTLADSTEEEATLKGSVAAMIEQYTSIIRNYACVSLTASFPVPDLVYAEACLKIARLLTTVYLNQGWNQPSLILLVQHKLTKETHLNGLSFIDSTKNSRTCRIPRYQIAEFVNKVWNVRINELPIFDQIHIITSMSSIFSIVGYHRKAGYAIHESIKRILPLLIQHRRSSKQHNDDHGVLELLLKQCDVYGLGHLEQRHMSVGWPDIQMTILQQCIAVSEACSDHNARLYYTTLLLKQLYRYIPRAEQIRLATSIQGMLTAAAKDTSTQNEMRVNYWGVNLVSRIEALTPISRKAVYEHKVVMTDETAKRDSNDPFIYNPFTAKKSDANNKILLVKDEVSEFKVTLSNPFAFDLELQQITLSTLGIKFNAVPNMVTIPANATIPIILVGTPLETGILRICGCFIQIIGFAEQEFLVEKGNVNAKKKSEEILSIYTVHINSGLEAIKPNRTADVIVDEQQEKANNFYELTVIEEQPLLKIKSTSLLHDAVMLYEGEMTHITIELENIGRIPVDSISLSFTDSTMTSTHYPTNLFPEDQYELELYTTGTRVFSWDHQQQEFLLFPGEKKSIEINVYGKQECRGGTMQIGYSYMDRQQQTVKMASVYYTRQLYLNIMITVYQNLEPLHWDIVYLRHSLPKSSKILTTAEQPQTRVEDLLLLACNTTENEYCLVALDVSNRWTVPFDVQFTIDNRKNETEEKFVYTITIQPGSTSRVILPLRRLFLSSEIWHQEIPSFDPHKQFVVTQQDMLLNEERLKMFWYREEVLKRIKASWHQPTTLRTGELNLRPSLRLTETQLGILKKEDVEFLIDINSQQQDNVVTKISHRRFRCLCNEPIIMTVSIRNRLCKWSPYFSV
ncbi:MAG: TRAPP II complex [Benjaminiella poitrasii]|nr:MAG: TRAPP II complex [Benjaminiella poitrasii]